MTPYEAHKSLNHKVTTSSPNGFDTLEECQECGARFLIPAGDSRPRSLHNMRASLAILDQANPLPGESRVRAYDRKNRNAYRRARNAMLREVCGTSARAAREDMGL